MLQNLYLLNQNIPEVIIVNHDITVVPEIEFHDLDINLKIEYCLRLLVYDIHGKVGSPLLIQNWDESEIVSISLDRHDDYLGVTTEKINVVEKRQIITSRMSLKLGKLIHLNSHYS